MAIFGPSWASGDQITRTKQANMVSDGINSADDIHPQYNSPLLDMSTGFVFHLRSVGPQYTFYAAWRPPIVGSLPYTTYDDDEVKYYNLTLAAGVNHAASVNTISFLKGIWDEINIEGLMLATRVNGAETAEGKCRVYKITNAGVQTLLHTGAIKTVAYDAAWHRVEFDSGAALSLAAAAATDIIKVWIDLETTVQDIVNDQISAYIKNLKVTRTAT